MTVNPNHVARSGLPDSRIALWEGWISLWNGDLAIADEIIAPGFSGHRAGSGSGADHVTGRAALISWICAIHDPFTDSRLTVEVGPIVDADLVAGRWSFTGSCRAGAGAPAGTWIRFTGMDIVRVAAGRVVEHWGNVDRLGLLTQMGARADGEGCWLAS